MHLPLRGLTPAARRAIALVLLLALLILPACRPSASAANVPAGHNGGGMDGASGHGGADTGGERATYTDDDWVFVKQEPISLTVPAIGSFGPRQSTMLGSQITARVETVHADIGHIVDATTPLVQLDLTFLKLEVAAREADLSAAQASQAEAQLNYNRMKALFEKPQGVDPSVPRKLFDDAAARLEQANAMVLVADAGVQLARQRRDEATIRAPFRGVITQRLVDPGAMVTAQPLTNLMEIQEIHTLYLEFPLPQDQLNDVHEADPDTPGSGTAVTFTVDGLNDSDGDGRISRIFPAINPATRSFRCRVVVPNAGLRYRPGMLVNVRVTIREVPDALVVPRSAVAHTVDGWHAWRRRNGRPEKTAVTVGVMAGDRVQIESGLAGNDRILAHAE